MDEARVKDLDLFSSLSRKERKELARHADELDFPEGKELVREGEFAYEFFVIESGRAEVVRGDEHVADLGPGDFLGEMGIVARATRNASVIARSPMTVMVMTEQAFRTMERSIPSVASRIREAVEERSRALA
ncbi:MAG TPA: cyclic nucleotide-binding domain-containing protein [Thermoleophilaceae bacterium]|nr:cyclic nucleotide-binding domain-containing protein [Thermoleophilaceae bacterium]